MEKDNDNLSALPEIELSSEPLSLPLAENETWIRYEMRDGEREYTRIVLDPPAVRHLEWSCRAKKIDPSFYLETNHDAFKRWFACLGRAERKSAITKCKGIADETLPTHIILGTIELHREDGSVETREGVAIPRICFWIDDIRKWWDWERCFLSCMIDLFEWIGESASCPRFDSWKSALQIMNDFLDCGASVPDRGMIDLLHYDEASLPEWGGELPQYGAEHYLQRIPREILEKYCPPPSPERETESWILFQKTDGVYSKVVFLPPASRRFEWEWQEAGKEPAKCIPNLTKAVERWFASLTPVQRCSAWIECRGCETEEPTVKGEIELQREEGSNWLLTPVTLPNVRWWIANEHNNWMELWRRISCTISLFEWEGTPERLQQVESFNRARNYLEDYLMRGIVMPKSEFEAITDEWKAFEVDRRERTAVDFAVEHEMDEIPRPILEQYFPKKD